MSGREARPGKAVKAVKKLGQCKEMRTITRG